jgi:hypothetical protein
MLKKELYLNVQIPDISKQMEIEKLAKHSHRGYIGNWSEQRSNISSHQGGGEGEE